MLHIQNQQLELLVKMNLVKLRRLVRVLNNLSYWVISFKMLMKIANI